MQVLTGTSGFSYPAWRGTFYPEKWPEPKMLGFYAERLGAVEINNTFYRMPSAETLGKWAADTPAHFRFALKSPRRITHEKKLGDVASSLERLAEAARSLGEKLGPVLFQLPPFFRKDVPRHQCPWNQDSRPLHLPVGQSFQNSFRLELRRDYIGAQAIDCQRFRGARPDTANVKPGQDTHIALAFQ